MFLVFSYFLYDSAILIVPKYIQNLCVNQRLFQDIFRAI